MRALPQRQLDRRITRVWRLSALINVLIWFGLLVAGTAVAGRTLRALDTQPARVLGTGFFILALALAGLAVVLLVALVGVTPKIRWLQWRFDVLEEEIDLHHGIFWRRRVIIPLVRVQNVETRQGPILRANGLASLTVATAGGQHEIPGLAVAEADALRDHVAVLARLAPDDV